MERMWWMGDGLNATDKRFLKSKMATISCPEVSESSKSMTRVAYDGEEK